ncbi:MAG: mechanosensitive ion channel family protein, partial [Deltaproteobacteria bacterium]|nr:mechanosensitive ion channel family protein [Deltaproteobacteria bacterium]
KAVEVLSDLMKKETRILADPPPMIAVSELADSSVNLVVRPWVKKENYWPVKFDLTRAVKESFDANGIEIPFPQRVVHTVKEMRE